MVLGKLIDNDQTILASQLGQHQRYRGQTPAYHRVHPRAKHRVRRQPEIMLSPRAGNGRGHCHHGAPRLPIHAPTHPRHVLHDWQRTLPLRARLTHSGWPRGRQRNAPLEIHREPRLNLFRKRHDGRKTIRIPHGIPRILERTTRKPPTRTQFGRLRIR